MTDTSARIGMLAPMPSELGPVVKAARLERGTFGGTHAHTGTVGACDVVATKTGIGTKLAAEATERLLDAGTIDLVLVVGIAGGVPDKIAVGEVILPEVVVDAATGSEYRPAPLEGLSPRGRLETSDDFAVDDRDFARYAEHGVVALDMETSAVAAVCERRGVQWSVVRAISDMAGVTPDDVIGLANADGTPNLGAGLRYMVRHPMRVPGLVKLARDSTRAANLAARAAVRAIEARR
jgi:adenosylhomocysteine nucleosidase